MVVENSGPRDYWKSDERDSKMYFKRNGDGASEMVLALVGGLMKKLLRGLLGPLVLGLVRRLVRWLAEGLLRALNRGWC